MSRNLDIAVCGAGVGGLAAAVLLARSGHKVRVFDQFEQPKAIGSGLMLQCTGLAVLDALGLRDSIEKLGSPIDRLWGISTPSGRPVLDVRYTRWRAGLYGVGVQRGMLFETLLAAARAADIELIGDTHIMAADGDSGTFDTASAKLLGPFDLVIDALGVRSPLSQDPRRELPYGALWATLPWPEGVGFDARALEQRYLRACQMAGVMASGRRTADGPRTLTYFWSIRADDEPAWRRQNFAQWQSEARALWPKTEVLLNQLTDHDDLTFARYRHRTLGNPISGPRLVHIGDAWHAASPQLGQGANMALLDAWALASALTATKEDVGAALCRYRRLRQGHVRLYQILTWLFTPVYQGDSWILPWLRDWLAAPLSRLWPAPPLLAALVSGMIGSPLQRLGLNDRAQEAILKSDDASPTNVG